MTCCGPVPTNFFHQHLTAIGTPLLVYIVPGGMTAEVQFVSFGNVDAAIREVSVWIDRSGVGTFDDTTKIFDGRNIEANATDGVPVKWILPAGTQIAIDADAVDKVFVTFDGVLHDDS